MFAALQVAREFAADTTVVVLLPDTGRGYLSKVYSESWMLQYGMLERPEAIRVEEVLASKGGEMPTLVTVDAHAKVRHAVDVLKEHDISQAPVVRGEGADVSSFVGSIRDRELLERVFRDPDALQADVAEVMAAPIAMVEWDHPIESAFAELEHGPAVLVAKAGQVLGVLRGATCWTSWPTAGRAEPERRRAVAGHRRGRRQGARPGPARRTAGAAAGSFPCGRS